MASPAATLVIQAANGIERSSYLVISEPSLRKTFSVMPSASSRLRTMVSTYEKTSSAWRA